MKRLWQITRTITRRNAKLLRFTAAIEAHDFDLDFHFTPFIWSFEFRRRPMMQEKGFRLFAGPFLLSVEWGGFSMRPYHYE